MSLSDFKEPHKIDEWGRRMYASTSEADLTGVLVRADAIMGKRRKSRRKKYKFFNRGCVTVYNNKSLTSRGGLPIEDRRRAKRRRKKHKQLALARKQESLKETVFSKGVKCVAGVDRPPRVDECYLEVQNWVITCEIEAPMHPAAARYTRFSIDLHQIAVSLRYKGMQYNPERFHAGITRFRNPHGAVLVFSGCAVVCTGAKTQDRSELLVSTTISNIASLPEYRGLRMKAGSWNVRNVVGSATMPFTIDLDRLYNANVQYCAYDPNIFPGATFRLINPWARAILIFNSGKCVITGGKSDKDLPKALALCIPYIWAAREGISAKQAALDAPKKTADERIQEQLIKDANICSPSPSRVSLKKTIDPLTERWSLDESVFDDSTLRDDPYHELAETAAGYGPGEL